MNISNLGEIIKLAASTENTPELQMYWEKRYKDLLDRNLFKISSKTLAILAEETQVTKPATPFGDIVLVNHLDKNQTLDELSLQTTLESAVRFLDSIVDRIDFTSEAKFIVSQYRKIGLGLFDFKDYLALKKSAAELDEIDYIGSLVSSGSYRASESLAEEKGVCINWDKIKKHLRPKSFEYWYEINSGEVKSGLEMTEDFDDESVKKSNYEIIPRRNSNILLFPADLEWQIWSDRDASAPKTEITHLEKDTLPEPNLTKKIEVVDEAPKSINDVEKESENQDAEIKTEDETLEQPTIATIASKKAPLVDSLSDAVSEGHQIIVEDDETELVPFDVPDTLQELKEAVTKQLEDKLEPILNAPIEQIRDVQITNDPQFQIGELVTIKSTEKAEYTGKVYQVIEILPIKKLGEENLYKLTGDDTELDELLWHESELTQVELVDILSKINHPQTAPEPIIQITEAITQHVHALVIADDKVLLEKIENELELPGGILPKNTLPETALEQILFEKYGLKGKVSNEVGSSITKSDDQNPSTLHLNFIFEVERQTNPDLRFYEKKELARASKYVLNILTKMEIQKQYFQVALANISTIQINNQPNTELTNTNTVTSKLNMAKYILKLEQLLQTEAFGKIKVSIQYDSKGARLIDLQGETVSPELETLLHTVLNLVNFSLKKNTSPTELAGLLQDQSDTAGPLTKLLKIVSEVLESAPGSVAEITPDLISDTLDNSTKTEAQEEKPVAPTPTPEFKAPEKPLAPRQEPLAKDESKSFFAAFKN